VNEEHEFDGKVVMQADSRLNYKTLKKVMYTASKAGYADMRLATIAFE
jgi:biopolymer transport protein ExbD